MAVVQAPRCDTDNKQLLLIVLSIIFMTVTALGISFRLHTRLFVLRKVFTEDLLMLAGTLSAFGMSSVYTAAAYHGYGKHLDEILQNPSDLIVLYKISFAIPYLYLTSSFLVKMSFLALYLRLDQGKSMRWTVYCLMFILIGQGLAAALFQSLAYTPPSQLMTTSRGSRVGFWTPETVQMFWNAIDIATAASSFAVYIIPLFMLHSWSLPRRQKFGVGALFALGFLVVIATCIRTYYGWQLIPSKDIYFNIVDSCIWSQAEIHLAILCGSAQTFRVLLRGFCPRCCRSPTNRNDTLPGFYPPIPPETPSPEHSRVDASPDRREDSWKGWELGMAELPGAYSTSDGNLARIVHLTSESNDVSALPTDVRPQFASITAHMQGNGVQSVWLFEAANDERFSPPWPLP